MRSREPFSTSWPRYITAMSSARYSTADRSWVMNRQGEPHVALQIREQVEHRGLHGHVEGAGGLVCDEQSRAGDQGPGDADPLPLPAGELVRVAARNLGAQPHPAQLF